MQLGTKIKLLRNSRKITTLDVANKVGIDVSKIISIEANSSIINEEELNKILQFFNTHIDSLTSEDNITFSNTHKEDISYFKQKLTLDSNQISPDLLELINNHIISCEFMINELKYFIANSCN
jgi:transcriptional regulator with XRE-family HTH domain